MAQILHNGNILAVWDPSGLTLRMTPWPELATHAEKVAAWAPYVDSPDWISICVSDNPPAVAAALGGSWAVQPGEVPADWTPPPPEN